MDNTSQYLLTAAAAQYLSAGGRRASASLLRKFRMKGLTDPGDHGPRWVRDPGGYCLYRREDLDAYLAEWRARLRPMERRGIPPQLRMPTDEL
jgi:hypothetical protein